MEKQPTSNALIRFQDCDPMGHLNNGRYIDYFMNAREDHLAFHYDLHIYDMMRRQGRTWVVGKNEIVYRKPALLMEKVKIRTQVSHFSRRKIAVEMLMMNNSETEVKALMWSVFIPVDMKTQSSTEHTDDLMELLERVCVPGTETNITDRLSRIEDQMYAASAI